MKENDMCCANYSWDDLEGVEEFNEDQWEQFKEDACFEHTSQAELIFYVGYDEDAHLMEYLPLKDTPLWPLVLKARAEAFKYFCFYC